MVKFQGDRRFCEIKSVGYTEIGHDLKKDDITGQAVETIREFIFENLTAPTYREMMKSKELGRS